MAYFPIAFIAPNYRDYNNYWLKAYDPGTTTPKVMALDSAAGTTVVKLQVNADGFLKSSGGALVIPYIDGSYDAWLFPTEAEADSNTTTNALRVADNINSTNLPLINDPSFSFVFSDVNALVASTTVFTVGKILTTTVNNTDTNMGGAEYRVITAAEYAAETPLAPTPDGQLVGGRVIGMDHYLNGGTALIAKYNMAVGFDRACGVIGDDRLLGGSHDDLPALQKLVDWAMDNSPIDVGKIQKEYQKVFFHPRSIYLISGTWAIRNSRADWDFSQSYLVPMTAVTAIEWEGTLCTLQNLYIEGLTRLTRQDWFASGQSLFEWGKNEPVAYSNGSQIAIRNVILRGGYHSWSLNSVSPTDASFIWGSVFSQCYFENAVEYCYHLNSPQELSTTLTMGNSHARCSDRDAVTIGGFDYYCLQHHVADATNEPEVGANWEDYWHKEATFTPRGTWTISNQYLTNAKGFFFYNVSGVSMEGCSMDGGNNAVSGTVIDFFGQYIDMGVFHLEAFNHNVANTAKPILLNADWNITDLLIVANRWKLPTATDRAYFVGGNVANNKRGTFLAATILGALDVGIPTFINCEGYKSIDLGSGIPLNALVNPAGTTTAQRGISNRTVKVLSSGTSTINYTPDTRENGVLFTSGDGLADNILNITLDNMAAIASTDWDLNPQLDSYQMEFNSVAGPNGTGAINFIAGTGTPTFVGETTYSDGSTIRATKITTSKWLLEEVSSRGNIDGWIEYIPVGSYTSGTFTLPDSKTWNDIAELRMSSRSSTYSLTSHVNLVEGGILVGNNILRVQAIATSSSSEQLDFTDTATTATVSIPAGAGTITGASVKYK